MSIHVPNKTIVMRTKNPFPVPVKVDINHFIWHQPLNPKTENTKDHRALANKQCNNRQSTVL